MHAAPEKPLAPPTAPATTIDTESDLEERLTRPRPELCRSITAWKSPLVILGAGGKMGPSLAVLARRAAETAGHPLEVIAVSRFREPAARQWLEARGVKTIACDLFDPQAVAQLPDSDNVAYLVGLKFGTTANPAVTWASNTLLPARACERYPGARFVVVSTGNVYPLVQTGRPGANEDFPLTPVGEYANAAVARERLFEFYAGRHGTRVTLLRLSYAVELRYGVLVDIAHKLHQGEAIDLVNGSFNCIWQGDANEAILRALNLAKSPPTVWNLCRPEVLSVREAAAELADLLGRPPVFTGGESPTALLSDSTRLCALLGTPSVEVSTMLDWIAHWIRRGGRLLGKPTHFETRDGRY
jgi:nucleoside-diphosphate-sugar epimerase